jgi:L-fuconolactonase
MTRRDFANTAVATLLQQTPTMLTIIDTHQHLWHPKVTKLSWLQPGSVYDAPFTSKEYTAATEGLNVVGAVYMEVDVLPEDTQREADEIVALCKAGNTVTKAAVLGGRPASDGFAKYANQFKGSPYVKGLRQCLHVDSTPAGYCLKAEFVKGVQLLGDLGLSFDLVVRPMELNDFAKFIAQCPGTRFILDHCGNPNAKFTANEYAKWKAGLAAVAANKNVVCKVSGIAVNGYEKGKWGANELAPAVNFTLDTFGPDRVMFGGDWPVLVAVGQYSDWVRTLQQIVANRPVEQQQKLFSKNATHFFGLS